MIVYDITVPDFSDAERVQFTASVEDSLVDFIVEWWSDEWHMAITKDGEKRACTLHPNTLYFPDDPEWRLAVISEEETISQIALGGLHLQLAVNG